MRTLARVIRVTQPICHVIPGARVKDLIQETCQGANPTHENVRSTQFIRGMMKIEANTLGM